VRRSVRHFDSGTSAPARVRHRLLDTPQDAAPRHHVAAENAAAGIFCANAAPPPKKKKNRRGAHVLAKLT